MNETRETINTDEAAAFIGWKPQTLAVHRMNGSGPPYIRLGRSIRYRKCDLIEWLESNTVRPAGTRELQTA